MASETDEVVWVTLDVQLHRLIAEASGNPVFVTVLASISEALASQSSHLNLGPGRRASADIEHRGIISAITRGTIAEAEDAMQYHLDQGERRLAAAHAA